MLMISNQVSISEQTMALRILCLLSFLGFSHAGVLPLFDPKIVNGEDAKIGEIPYQVSLQYKDSSIHFCGGAILNDNYVITAAHCVDDEVANKIKVVASTINLKIPKSQHNVAEIIVHKEYDPSNSWIHDIALLKVKNPFKKSATVEYVPLPPKNYVIKANEVAVVSGWGTLWEDGPDTNKLKRVNILIADHAMCAYIYKFLKETVHPTHVCAYDPLIEKGICNGDSGGPLTVRGKLVGLVSWSSGCGTYPAVFTRVVSYLDWIKNNAI